MYKRSNMEAYRIKHKPTNLYYNRYEARYDRSNLVRSTRSKGTLFNAQEDNFLSCKEEYVTINMKVKSQFLSLYDKYFLKLEQKEARQRMISFKVPKTDFEIEAVEEEKEEEKEEKDATECTNIDPIQKLRAEINKLYKELNANVGLDNKYFLNKCSEIRILENKLNNLKKCS